MAFTHPIGSFGVLMPDCNNHLEMAAIFCRNVLPFSIAAIRAELHLSRVTGEDSLVPRIE
jgi:hypothetical protein